MDYLNEHNQSGLKVGDMVKITRIAESEENGWGDIWTDEMDKYVGKTTQIVKDMGILGFLCVPIQPNAYNDDWLFPYFVLEKV